MNPNHVHPTVLVLYTKQEYGCDPVRGMDQRSFFSMVVPPAGVGFRVNLGGLKNYLILFWGFLINN